MNNGNFKNGLNFQYYSSLFDEGPFKSIYMNETNLRFNKKFNELGQWLYHPRKKQWGILTLDGRWHDFNRINTHPNVLKYFCEIVLEQNPNFFIDFENPKFYEINIKKLWDFLEENFDLYFTEKITKKYIHKIKSLLLQSWNNGSISVIGAALYIQSLYPNSKINLTFETGLLEDFKGRDLTFYNNELIEKTLQIKSGKWVFDGDNYFIKGSPNKLNYKEDYYCYVDAGNDFNQRFTSVIMFENDTLINKNKETKELIVPKELVKNKPTREYMELPYNLKKAMTFCGPKDILFNIENGTDKNEVIYDDSSEEKKFIVRIKSIENEDSINELNKMIEEKLKELEETLK
jgi:hypothetical protein